MVGAKALETALRTTTAGDAPRLAAILIEACDGNIALATPLLVALFTSIASLARVVATASTVSRISPSRTWASLTGTGRGPAPRSAAGPIVGASHSQPPAAAAARTSRTRICRSRLNSGAPRAARHRRSALG